MAAERLAMGVTPLGGGRSSHRLDRGGRGHGVERGTDRPGS